MDGFTILLLITVALALVAAVVWAYRQLKGVDENGEPTKENKEKRLEITKAARPLIDDETVGAIVRQAGRLTHDSYRAMFTKYGGTGEMKNDGQRPHGGYCYNSSVHKAGAIEIANPTLQEDVGHWGKFTFYRFHDEGKEDDLYMAQYTKFSPFMRGMLEYSLEGYWIGAFPTLEEAVLAADYQWHYHKFTYQTFDEFAVDSGIDFIKSQKVKEQYYRDAGEFDKASEHRRIAENHADYLRNMHGWSFDAYYHYAFQYPTKEDKKTDEYREMMDNTIGEDAHGPMYVIEKLRAKGNDVTVKGDDAAVTYTGPTIEPDKED